ncbi:MAG: M48 family metallopeptidase [Pseudomonadota bacterium]
MSFKSPILFDGLTSGGRPVDLSWDDAALVIQDGDTLIRWGWVDLREMRDQADEQEVVFNHADASEARLIVYAPDMIEMIRARTPARHQIVVPKGTAKRLIFWASSAVASVLLIVFVIIPSLANVLTDLVPVQREVALGNASMAQIERAFVQSGDNRFCIGDGGLDALNTMAERVTQDIESPYTYTIRVINFETENAFAVPGGNIVFFDGLIQQATTPEQVAGVLAHEIAHVENRDSLRLLLRSAGSAGILSMLIGDFAGGALVLVVSEALINASHSQEVERNADAFAHERLAEAGLPSTPFAEFFDFLHEKYGIEDSQVGTLLSYISTHPDTLGRAAEARAANTVEGDFVPVVTEEEWAALRAICDELEELTEE